MMKIVVALLLSALATSSCSPTRQAENIPDLNSTIKVLGYNSLALPSTAYGPGSLVTSVKGSGLVAPLNLTYLCRPDFAHAPPAIIDTAASADASRSLNSSFKLDPSTLTQIGLGASASYLDTVTLKLSNVSVEQLAFDDLETVRSTLGPSCKQIVADFSKKSLAYQTKQAIRADVTYSFKLKVGASAEAKGLVIKALASAFGGSIESDQGSTVSGKGLFYGLILTKV
ncbi:hypothetical protein ELI03_34735 [Rhizobium leguminosarum]|uniref:Uncharacterized protein n=1 Tax=Rhizobium leguminosarum TaxID=384 RepID=A0A4Q8XRU2_RHILE|nr:hypothetical protein [Rhizobium leguminosarum]TAX64414.1 hypothetical protein ELI03_34735 [Rhizobium leguminosarum]